MHERRPSSLTPGRHSRAGFTLPELLVAAAVSMVIMAIIAVAFQKGVDAFRTLRAVALMQDKLRSVENVLKRDLASQHFGGQFQEGFSGPSVRDQRLDLIGWMPPSQGYFDLYAPPVVPAEGVDSDGLRSTIATNHWMRFTVQLTGKRQEDWFYAQAAPGVAGDANFNSPGLIASRWAEIGYFLYRDPNPANSDNANGNPLYTLYRRQRLIPPTAVAGTLSAQTYPDLSISPPAKSPDPRPAGYTVNTPASVTMHVNRLPLVPQSGAGQGDDILLTDVLSFEIRAHWMSGTAIPLNDAQFLFPPPLQNHDYPFSALIFSASPNPSFNYRFDTGSTGDSNHIQPPVDWYNPVSFLQKSPFVPHNRIRLDSLQIRIRIWDPRTGTARQMTIIQDI